MIYEAPPARVAERLRRVDEMELGFAALLDHRSNGEISEQLARMRSLADQHHKTLAGLGAVVIASPSAGSHRR